MTIYGIPDRDTLTEQQQLVVKGLYNLWLKNAIDLIKNSFGLTYNEEGTQNHRLGLVFIDNEKTGIRAGVDSKSTDGDKKTLGGTKLIINMAHLKDLSEDNLIADDIHRTLAHELVHGLMSINFDYCSELPGWFTESECIGRHFATRILGR